MFRATLTCLILAVMAAPSGAQRVISARAGMIYYAEGAVTFDGIPARALAGERYPALKDGQLLATEQGHAEILLGSGAVLWAGQNSKIRLQNSSLDDTHFLLESGSAIIEAVSVPEGNRIRVDAGAASVEVLRPGLYRFEAGPPLARVYDGEASASGLRVRKGQEVRLSPESAVTAFQRPRPDELLYWAAWRSFQLAAETRSRETEWQPAGLYGDNIRHSAFGIEFSRNGGAQRLQYVTASAPGLVNFLKGEVSLEGRSLTRQTRIPFRLMSDDVIITGAGASAELFLGVGVASRLGGNGRLRVMDGIPLDATVSLTQGQAVFEVTKAARDTRIRIVMGTTTTELLKPGIYEFDAAAGTVRVYGGEAATLEDGKKWTTRRTQMLTLGPSPKVARFDSKQKDALYQWAYDRSMALAHTNAGFMTQWERVGRVVRHPQYGNW